MWAVWLFACVQAEQALRFSLNNALGLREERTINKLTDPRYHFNYHFNKPGSHNFYSFFIERKLVRKASFETVNYNEINKIKLSFKAEQIQDKEREIYIILL